ncbi:hypothetical protein HYR54_06280 [Candidatus Acetothermia bacterium]|nr:hypothetical protein [Candidatus Acetothermia bacterium]
MNGSLLKRKKGLSGCSTNSRVINPSIRIFLAFILILCTSAGISFAFSFAGGKTSKGDTCLPANEIVRWANNGGSREKGATNSLLSVALPDKSVQSDSYKQRGLAGGIEISVDTNFWEQLQMAFPTVPGEEKPTPQQLRQAMLGALQDWETASEGVLRFYFVDDKILAKKDYSSDGIGRPNGAEVDLFTLSPLGDPNIKIPEGANAVTRLCAWSNCQGTGENRPLATNGERQPGEAIVSADIFFRTDKKNYTLLETGGTDLIAVFKHEIGHALGLGHTDECMNSKNKQGVVTVLKNAKIDSSFKPCDIDKKKDLYKQLKARDPDSSAHVMNSMSTRTITEDDRDAIRFLYPKCPATLELSEPIRNRTGVSEPINNQGRVMLTTLSPLPENIITSYAANKVSTGAGTGIVGPPSAFSLPVSLFSLETTSALLDLPVKVTRLSIVDESALIDIKLTSSLRRLNIPGLNFTSVFGDEPLLSDPPPNNTSDADTEFSVKYIYPSRLDIGGDMGPEGKPFKGSICVPFANILKPTSNMRFHCKPEQVEIRLGVDGSFTFSLDYKKGDFLLGGLSLPEVDLFGTGIKIFASNVAVDVSQSSNIWEEIRNNLSDVETVAFDTEFAKLKKAYGDGLDDPAWKGVYIQQASVNLKDFIGLDFPGVDLKAHHLIIDNNGFTGVLSLPAAQIANNETDRQISIGGFSVTLADIKSKPAIEVIFVRNTFNGAFIRGKLELPFSGSQSIPIEFSFDMDGNWSAQVDPDTVLKICFPKCEAEHIRLYLQKLRLGTKSEVNPETGKKPVVLQIDGKVSIEGIKIGGKDLFPDPLTCGSKPEVKGNSDFEQCGLVNFSGLEITFSSPGKLGTSQGVGGWLDLQKAGLVDFGDFPFCIQKIGLGWDPSGEKWFGLGGYFNIGEDFGVEATVNEVRFRWDKLGDPGLKLEVIDIAIKAHWKDIVDMNGSIRWDQNEFRGQIQAGIDPPGIAVGVTLIIGHREVNGRPYRFWYFDGDLELPEGIPLTIGLSIYGFKGGLGYNVRPELVDKKPEGHPDGVFDDVVWKDEKTDKYVFTVGLTLGDNADGTTFITDLAFLIDPSGPVLILQGKGWIMTPRLERFSEPSTLDAIISYDGSKQAFLVAITGIYSVKDPQIKDGVTVADLHGTFEILEAPGEWHIYFGRRDPKEKQNAVVALPDVFGDKIKASGYFMMGSKVLFPPEMPGPLSPGILFGAFLRIDDIDKDFGIGHVSFRAYAGGELVVGPNPKDFWIALALGGHLSLEIAGVGLTVGLDATIDGMFPKPQFARASIHVQISLFLFDIDKTVLLCFIGDENCEDSRHPDFSNPLESVELNFPIKNLRAGIKQPKGLVLTQHEPFADKITSRHPELPKQADGSTATVMEPISLNPRFALNFQRAIDGRSEFNALGDIQANEGATKREDKAGEWIAWYRLKDVKLHTTHIIGIPDRLGPSIDSRCGVLDNPPLTLVGHWGRLLQLNDENELVNSEPTVNGPRDAGDIQTIQEQRRQTLFFNVAAKSDDKDIRSDFSSDSSLKNIPRPFQPRALEPDKLYQVRVTNRWEWQKNNGTSPGNGSDELVFCFRTGPPPDDLSSYVAWTQPADQAANAFLDEPIWVVFNTAGMESVYANPSQPSGRFPVIELYNQDNQLIASKVTPLSESLLDGQILGCVEGLPAVTASLFGQLQKQCRSPLQPRSRYFVWLAQTVRFGDLTVSVPVFKFQFSTSAFANFSNLMEASRLGGQGVEALEVQTASGTTSLPTINPEEFRPILPVPEPTGQYIVVKSAEPIFLGTTPKDTATGATRKVTFLLCQGRIHTRGDCVTQISVDRLSPDQETTNLFVPKSPLTPNQEYTLLFEYEAGVLKDRIPSLDFASESDLAPFVVKQTVGLVFKVKP